MKLSRTLFNKIVVGCVVLIAQTASVDPVKAQQKLQSGMAGATTTPQYAKKVALTYCDFLTAGIEPSIAIGQAEAEVRTSARRPVPFNKLVYEQTLEKAITEKGFCPSVPRIEEVVLEQASSSCTLSPRDMLAFERMAKSKK